jgi:hypothetical protein
VVRFGAPAPAGREAVEARSAGAPGLGADAFADPLARATDLEARCRGG